MCCFYEWNPLFFALIFSKESVDFHLVYDFKPYATNERASIGVQNIYSTEHANALLLNFKQEYFVLVQWNEPCSPRTYNVQKGKTMPFAICSWRSVLVYKTTNEALLFVFDNDFYRSNWEL